MNIIKTVLLGAIITAMITGCSCSTRENYENTTATHKPTSKPAATESIKNDGENIVNDAENMADDAGRAVKNAADDIGNAMR